MTRIAKFGKGTVLVTANETDEKIGYASAIAMLLRNLWNLKEESEWFLHGFSNALSDFADDLKDEAFVGPASKEDIQRVIDKWDPKNRELGKSWKKS